MTIVCTSAGKPGSCWPIGAGSSVSTRIRTSTLLPPLNGGFPESSV